MGSAKASSISACPATRPPGPVQCGGPAHPGGFRHRAEPRRTVRDGLPRRVKSQFELVAAAPARWPSCRFETGLLSRPRICRQSSTPAARTIDRSRSGDMEVDAGLRYRPLCGPVVGTEACPRGLGQRPNPERLAADNPLAVVVPVTVPLGRDTQGPDIEVAAAERIGRDYGHDHEELDVHTYFYPVERDRAARDLSRHAGWSIPYGNAIQDTVTESAGAHIDRHHLVHVLGLAPRIGDTVAEELDDGCTRIRRRAYTHAEWRHDSRQ